MTDLKPVAAWNTRAPQWQPIETAPKDGTHVLVCYSSDGKQDMSVAWWDSEVRDHLVYTSPDGRQMTEDEWLSEGLEYSELDDLELDTVYTGGWVDGTEEDYMYESRLKVLTPTAWMPLPDPPENMRNEMKRPLKELRGEPDE